MSKPSQGQASIAAAERAVQARQYLKAAQFYEAAFGNGPVDGRTLGNYGGLLNELCRFDDAAQILSRAVAIEPGRAASWLNLGVTMLELQRYDDAIAAFSTSLRLRPLHAGALSGLGVSLQRHGTPVEALPFLDLALSLEPDSPQGQYNRALALLAAGDYGRGLPAFESRFNLRGGVRIEGQRWKGEDFSSRTLLVLVEAGFGDVLQFARFLPLAKARGGRVVLWCWPTLATLLSRLDGVDEVVSTDTAFPLHDVICPIMSLASALGTTIDTVPLSGGYLTADPVTTVIWRDRIADDATRHGNVNSLRVGLVWAGGDRRRDRSDTLMDSRRSLGIESLEPLFHARPDVMFYSLQIGAGALPPDHALPVIDHTGLISSFDDTACLVSQLDLVVSVDTSTAHLAGGLGRPVWLLSRYDQCWRWLTGRTDTPWYSKMRLYVQQEPGDWADPIARIALDFANLPLYRDHIQRVIDA